VTDVVIDRDTVDATPIGGPEWFEEDFEDEVQDEDEVENEADGEGIAGGVQVNAESGGGNEAGQRGGGSDDTAGARPKSVVGDGRPEPQ
jgi:hypothetical protein